MWTKIPSEHNMAQHDLTEAVHYHYGAFPPRGLDYERLLDPLAEATAALARYDQMLASMHNGEILLAPLRNQEAVVSSRMEGTISPGRDSCASMIVP